MSDQFNDNFGETSLGQVILYIKSHFYDLIHHWYVILIGFIIFGSLGAFYGFTRTGIYISKPMFSAETSDGGGGMMSTAMNLAGKFGISSGGGGERVVSQRIIYYPLRNRVGQLNLLYWKGST